MKQKKDELRQRMKALRQDVLGDKQTAGEEAAALFLDAFHLQPKTVVSAYWSMDTELPTLPLMQALHEQECVCCLPITQPNRGPLSFAEWHPGSKMEPGYHSIPIPAEGALVEPDILVIPLLAFTRDGHRLGFGKGHYDYTLEALRKKKDVFAVGYAYAQQEVDRLPQDQYDQPLDCIVTDQEVIRINV